MDSINQTSHQETISPQIPPATFPNNGLSKKKIFLFIGILFAILLIGSGGYLLGKNNNNVKNIPIPIPTDSNPLACSQEAKICPDGTTVGRVGPDCKFAPCPLDVDSTIPSTTSIIPLEPTGESAPTQNIWLKEEDDNRQIQVKVGQTFGIDLEANLSTGYSWYLVNMDTGILEQVGEPEFNQNPPPKEGWTGAPGRLKFSFKVIGKGTSDIRLDYSRSWEKEPPMKTYSVKIIAI